jgi:predicted sulfurtransferase
MKIILLYCFIAVSISACIQTAATGYENLDNTTFAEKMDDSGVIVIDVRTLDEYQRGHTGLL